MTAWIPALMAACEARGGRPRPSEAIGAVLLDGALHDGVRIGDAKAGRGGVSVEDAMSGVTIVVAAQPPVRLAVEVAIEAVLISPGEVEDDVANVAIVTRPSTQPDWHVRAADTGTPVVVLVRDIVDLVPEAARAAADRIVSLDGRLFPDDLATVIAMVTGEYVDLDGHWPALDVADAYACIRAGSTAIDCAARLHRLIESRNSSPPADPEPDEPEDHAEEPQSLGQAAAGVVRRLSEMTGFGDAGAWGLTLAADLRAYAAGQLPWSEVDRGILLAGPPGSGKTTFAKALALEAGVELVSSSYGDWSGGGYGDISKLMNKKFDAWREKAKKRPIVVLIDEIDSLGRRGKNAHNDSYWGSVINTLLAFLDGATPRNGIVVVGATNHASNVDAALTRPGRLDRVVQLPYPDASAMAGIVRHHLGPDAVLDDAELARAARACRGMSPASVEMTCREARRMARTMLRRRVCADDVCLVLGAQRLATLQVPGMAEMDRRVAVHEAGHAVAALEMGALLWVDMERPMTATVHRTLQPLAYVERRMTMLLSGMAAERLLLGEHTSGNQLDLIDATNLAARAHAAWGMGDTLRAHTVETALGDARIEAAVEAILRAAHQRALALVEQSRDAVLRLADRLQADRYLDAAEVRAVVEGPASESVVTKVVDRVSRVVGRRGRHPDPSP